MLRARPAQLVAVSLALTVLAASPAEARGPAQREKAERAVRAELARTLPLYHRVSCRAQRRAGRFTCSWSAERRLSPHRARRCRGRWRVQLRQGAKPRLRRLGGSGCSVRVRAIDAWFGFNDNAIRAGAISPERDAALTEGAGAGLHRLAFDWRYAEPSRDVYRFEEYDRIYRAMLARGIRPVFILVFAPSWTWDPFTFCSGDCRYPPGRAFDAEWREIAALLATRYPRAAGIEIWNEPNDERFWHGQVDAARYAELLTEAHRAVKQANPSMSVVTGGFADPSPAHGIGLRDFLSGVFEAGAADSFDALAFHLYPRDPSLAELAPTLELVRGLRDRFRPDRPPLWVSETGFTTTGPSPPRLSSEEQAASLVGLYRALRSEPDVQAVVFHSLLEPRGDVRSPDTGYGIVRADLTKKPAYCALVRELETGAPCP